MPDSKMSLIAVLTSTDSAGEARNIAQALVESRLAACVQISSIESCYRWQGELQMEPEHRLLIKTSRDRYADVEAAILELHSYDLPAIVAFDLANAHQPFAEWVESAVGP